MSESLRFQVTSIELFQPDYCSKSEMKSYWDPNQGQNLVILFVFRSRKLNIISPRIDSSNFRENWFKIENI